MEALALEDDDVILQTLSDDMIQIYLSAQLTFAQLDLQQPHIEPCIGAGNQNVAVLIPHQHIQHGDQDFIQQQQVLEENLDEELSDMLLYLGLGKNLVVGLNVVQHVEPDVGEGSNAAGVDDHVEPHDDQQQLPDNWQANFPPVPNIPELQGYYPVADDDNDDDDNDEEGLDVDDDNDDEGLDAANVDDPNIGLDDKQKAVISRVLPKAGLATEPGLGLEEQQQADQQELPGAVAEPGLGPEEEHLPDQEELPDNWQDSFPPIPNLGEF